MRLPFCVIDKKLTFATPKELIRIQYKTESKLLVLDLARSIRRSTRSIRRTGTGTGTGTAVLRETARPYSYLQYSRDPYSVLVLAHCFSESAPADGWPSRYVLYCRVCAGAELGIRAVVAARGAEARAACCPPGALSRTLGISALFRVIPVTSGLPSDAAPPRCPSFGAPSVLLPRSPDATRTHRHQPPPEPLGP
jgi:hypothetical protein